MILIEPWLYAQLPKEECEPAMDRKVTGRYAIYYAPEEGTLLHEVGSKWLGRDAILGQDIPNCSVRGFTPARLQEITSAPRRYGLHATLKPPFHMVDTFPVEELLVAVRSFASEARPFSLPPLDLKWIGKFLALVPSEPCDQVSRLADECVRRFDKFRASPSREELAKRRAGGLTPRQEELLEKWGYPYVMDEFRFHISLTSPMKDAEERRRIFSAADDLTANCRRLPVEIASICIFRQEHREAPFRMFQRFRFLDAS